MPDRTQLLRRATAALAPWRKDAYPGRDRLLADLLHVSVGTAHWYIYAGILPSRTAARMAKILEAKAAALSALAAELRARVK